MAFADANASIILLKKRFHFYAEHRHTVQLA